MSVYRTAAADAVPFNISNDTVLATATSSGAVPVFITKDKNVTIAELTTPTQNRVSENDIGWTLGYPDFNYRLYSGEVIYLNFSAAGVLVLNFEDFSAEFQA